ncbi:MerR family transcriptional regulator [Pseudactinotalea sp. HY158]|uniref:MerR family transcriptional regulator n=1 Tax=Pseudactinotalea sp. HY158 TaxID=2654547 RepID=UPI00129CB992|nr:MerR family transcriptional regulator [Pseudactinotalea sp. HY158]QGH68228.1 MerR family transcriptional regulator [Pseudactinotalea sp. HY158]
MRISELVAESGVPLPTVKYYLREGLLPAGEATGARSAAYGDHHLRRLRIIRALAEVAGLPLGRIRVIVALIDHPRDDLFDALGAAVAALPPQVDTAADYPRARAALTRLGQLYDPQYAAVAQLEEALRAADEAGLPISDARIDAYGGAVRALAEFDLDHAPEPADASAVVEYAVLGTALYEPVLLALRRLAHQHLAAERWRAPES